MSESDENVTVCASIPPMFESRIDCGIDCDVIATIFTEDGTASCMYVLVCHCISNVVYRK